ncbi:Gfo/Idh/MocA family protein [Pedobacter sp. NJ-S-72]
MQPEEPNSRRNFIKKTAVGLAVFSIVPRYVLGGNGFIAPSDKLTKAVIGVGGMGRNHFPYDGTQVVAICDVDKRHLALALPMLDKGVKTFSDYRELLKLPEVDIVHIATPPHWHGIMAVDAANAGRQGYLV